MAVRHWHRAAVLAALGAALALAGCGGGGGGGDAAPVMQGSIGGTATKGPVTGASVAAYAIDNGAMGRQLGAAVTDGQGHFSIPVGDYAGPVLVRMTGGHYVDEATGADVPLQAGDFLSAMLGAIHAGQMLDGVQVTPLTALAQAMAQRMAGGMTGTNIAAANASVGCYFGVDDIVRVPPMDPLHPPGTGLVDPDARNYGMALGAMSQLAADLGMPYAFGLVGAMMDDASDGWFNGMMAGSAIGMHGGMMATGTWPAWAGTSGLSNAMGTFVRSPRNQSGVTIQDMQSLMNRWMAASGEFPAGTCPASP